jgi:DNA-binding CsgD family transcriptional regulator
MTNLQNIAENRAVPGVLSFTATGDLLYMNGEAKYLCQQAQTSKPGNGIEHDLPSEVLDLCVELQGELKKQTTPHDCEKVEFRRVLGEVKSSVLLRGFLLPDHNCLQGSRLLILMEKLGRYDRVIPTQARDRFRLTVREQEVVKFIADGRTNKEIAVALSISEHTVKEHIRHLLRKTQSTTRTAVLAQIYRDS